MEHAASFLIGFELAAGAIVFAVALTVLLGRWVTGDESCLGVLLRGGFLAAFSAVAFRSFGTIWYWFALPTAMVPLVDTWFGKNLTASWFAGNRQMRLGAAMSAVAEQPANPILRLGLARVLLETGQIDAGLTALDEAVALAGDNGCSLIAEMAAEARAEFIRYCASCGHPNLHEAQICRRCLGALSGDQVSRALLWLCRPVLLAFRGMRRAV